MSSSLPPRLDEANDRFQDVLNTLLVRAAVDAGAVSHYPVATFDVSQYEFLLPHQSTVDVLPNTLSRAAMDLLRAVEQAGLDVSAFRYFLQCCEQAIVASCTFAFPVPLSRRVPLIQDLIAHLYAPAQDEMLLELYGRFLQDGQPGFEYRLRSALGSAVPTEFPNVHNIWAGMLNGLQIDLSTPLSLYGTGASHLRPSAVRLFGIGSVNIGLRFIFTQEWFRLADRIGEEFGSESFFPGEERTITERSVVTQRDSLASSERQETELTGETTASRSDSSETMTDVQNRFRIAGEVDAAYNDLTFSASVHIESEYERQSQSRSTARRINDRTEKSARRSRQEKSSERKSERETTLERTRALTQRSKNDECVVTFVQERPMRNYGIRARLRSVERHLAVALEVPSGAGIREWVIRNARVVVRALRDPSLEKAVELLSVELPSSAALGSTEPSTGPINDLATASHTNFAQFNVTPDTSGPSNIAMADIYSKPMETFAQIEGARATRAREVRHQIGERLRLLQHIMDNILYYCHAVWRDLDPTQLRLQLDAAEVAVPTRWRLTADACVPHEADPRPMLVSRLIDFATPMAFHGNYAIFRLWRLPTRGELGIPDGGDVVALGSVYDFALSHYVSPTSGASFRDPGIDFYRARAETIQVDARLAADIAQVMPEFHDRVYRDNEEGRPVLRNLNEIRNALSTDDIALYMLLRDAWRRVEFPGGLRVRSEVSDGSIMEPYKLVSRFIDAVNEYDKHRDAESKLQRRGRHIDTVEYQDPDIA